MDIAAPPINPPKLHSAQYDPVTQSSKTSGELIFDAGNLNIHRSVKDGQKPKITRQYSDLALCRAIALISS